MTPNEVRTREGLNRIAEPGADQLGGMLANGSPPLLALTDQSCRSGPERLVDKEVAAVRRAAQRFAGDAAGFEEWLEAFYGGHVSLVMDLLKLPKESAKLYCNLAKDELIKATDLNDTLDAWTENRVEELAVALAQHEGNGKSEETR